MKKSTHKQNSKKTHKRSGKKKTSHKRSGKKKSTHKRSGKKKSSQLKFKLKRKSKSKRGVNSKKKSLLGGSLLKVVGSVAGKLVSSTLKSNPNLVKQLNDNVLKNIKGEAVKMANSHIDNLANTLHQNTGLKVDTKDIKQNITNTANKIQIKTGGAFPAIALAGVGSLAGKLIGSVAKSGVANSLIKGVTSNASNIGQSLIDQGKRQAIELANQQLNKLTAGQLSIQQSPQDSQQQAHRR